MYVCTCHTYQIAVYITSTADQFPVPPHMLDPCTNHIIHIISNDHADPITE